MARRIFLFEGKKWELSQARCIVHVVYLSHNPLGLPLVCQSQSCIVIRITSLVIKRCLILFSVCRIIFICELSAFVSFVHDIVMRVSKFCSITRRKRADLFLVCYRSVETSAADLQIVYRSRTDYLRIVCRISAEYLQNICRMSAEMICNLCRRSADEGGINSKHNIRRTAPIKHLLFLS